MPKKKNSEILLQKTGKNSVPNKAEFQNIFKDISSDLTTEIKFQDSAVNTLKESTEKFLNEWMEDIQICAKISNHATPSIRDMKLARRMRE